MSLENWFMAVGIDPSGMTSSKKKRKYCKVTDAIVEKSYELKGRTASFFVMKKMLTAKSFGVHACRNNYQAQIQLAAPKIRLTKSFLSESDAISQHHTWVNQLTLDDGVIGVNPQLKRWRARRRINEKQIDCIKQFVNEEETGGPKKVYTSLNDAQQQEFKKR